MYKIHSRWWCLWAIHVDFYDSKVFHKFKFAKYVPPISNDLLFSDPKNPVMLDISNQPNFEVLPVAVGKKFLEWYVISFGYSLFCGRYGGGPEIISEVANVHGRDQSLYVTITAVTTALGKPFFFDARKTMTASCLTEKISQYSLNYIRR